MKTQSVRGRPQVGKPKDTAWEGSLRQIRDSGFAILLIVACADAMGRYLSQLRRTLDKKMSEMWQEN